MPDPPRDEPDDSDDASTRLPGNPDSEPPTGEAAPGDGSSPGRGDPTVDDLVSLPPPGAGKRLPPGLSRPAPSLGPTPGVPRAPGTPGPPRPPGPPSPEPTIDEPDEAETVAEALRTELPTADVGHQRSEKTEHEAAAGTPAARQTAADADAADEAETMLEAPAGTPGAPGTGKTPAPTLGDPGAGSKTQRSQGPVPASKFSRGTARDPIAGTATGRGTAPGGRLPPTTLREGELLADRYELVKRLGKGGMGEVWQAKHTLLQGMRAIKVIKASISREPSFRARFLSEGQTMMRVKHEGVVEVTDLDETRQNRELFMVMEYLKGRTMHDAVRDPEKPLGADVRTAVRIHCELAEGMQRIHDEHIVHKDLKTDNVLLVVGEDGIEHPKVIDFGLAKRVDGVDVAPEQGVALSGTDVSDQSRADTKTTLSGTLAYMAPEQFRSEPSSYQSDLYAFGVMLYECFQRGEYPMPRGSLADYLNRHRLGEVPRRLRQVRPDLDPDIAELADRCMAPRREDRPKSFREVCDALQWWLDAPERARRRNRVLLMAGTAAALVGLAITGFVLREKTAALSSEKLLVAGADLEKRAGRYWLPEAGLAALGFEAVLDGDAKAPTLEVDGTATSAAQFEARDGRLRASFDLSGLPDGPHDLAFRASSGAAATKVPVTIDRTPPEVTDVRLAEGKGTFTKSPSPVLVVTLSEPQDRLVEVYAVLDDAGREIRKSADRDDDPRKWRLSGTARTGGEAVVRVFALDLAGNRSRPREFRYVQDSVVPPLAAEGLLGNVFQVRAAAGNRLRLKADEPVEVVATFTRPGDPVPVERKHDFATQFEVDVPEVAGAGFAAKVVAADRAGNERTLEFDVKVVADEAGLVTKDGERTRGVRGDADLVLELRRTYAVGEGVRIVRARLRDAAGNPAPEPPVDLGDAQLRATADPRVAEVVIPRGTPPGAWAISAVGMEDAESVPFTLVVDAETPRVGNVVVRDAEGRVVPPGGWSLSADVVVEAEVADLSLASVKLGAMPPEGEVKPGSGTYRFRVRADRQGLATWTLVAADQAGNSSEQTVGVKCDWEAPQLTLESPRTGAQLDDRNPTLFAGTCSEAAFRLVVTGLEKEIRTEHTEEAFSVPHVLPSGEWTLSVVAEDPAGRRSSPAVLRLSVSKVITELPDLIAWKVGTACDMQKVVAGDVVLEGRTQPVGRVFLDRTEVTNRQYRAFLAACAAHPAKSPWDHRDQPKGWSHVPAKETWADPKWNGDDLPVVNVGWWDAYAFAKWSGRRLPTEAEWVKAAAKSRAAEELELRSWPPIAAGAPWKDGLLATAEMTKQAGPVRADQGADESPSKCLHMGGNVSEWVDVPFAATGEPRTGVRGGNYWMTRFAADVRRVPTKRYDPSFRARTIGFRCAVDESAVPQ